MLAPLENGPDCAFLLLSSLIFDLNDDYLLWGISLNGVRDVSPFITGCSIAAFYCVVRIDTKLLWCCMSPRHGMIFGVAYFSAEKLLPLGSACAKTPKTASRLVDMLLWVII